MMPPQLILLLLTSVCASAALPPALLQKEAEWFRSPEGRAATANVLSWQSVPGAWPKNQDNSGELHRGDSAGIIGTFDNKATTDEMRFLARAFEATGDELCAKAFRRGLDHILAAQYPNGGFPQRHPPGQQYHRHITFNDGTMIRLLRLLRSVADDEWRGLVETGGGDAARRALDRGVNCILECQIRVGGKRTVWCAQHDEITLAPAAARAYELPSLSGSESAGILSFLMSIQHPSPQVIGAVKAGVAWFEQAKIKGAKVEKADGDARLTLDPAAPGLWARFYDIETGRPFFCDRDGVKKAQLADIGAERRNGYAWYGNWGEAVLNEYARWPHR
ncbi:pectate lyase [Luteolibacter sp. Populi]|uniref:pectate lyase n=1 Tax=Luteolibacter sp. Populi TaxID=3230487 RepID=UPI0034679984